MVVLLSWGWSSHFMHQEWPSGLIMKKPCFKFLCIFNLKIYIFQVSKLNFIKNKDKSNWKRNRNKSMLLCRRKVVPSLLLNLKLLLLLLLIQLLILQIFHLEQSPVWLVSFDFEVEQFAQFLKIFHLVPGHSHCKIQGQEVSNILHVQLYLLACHSHQPLY